MSAESPVGRDRLGNPVARGDKVHLLSIRPSILKRLEATAELGDVASMLNQVVSVFDVYDDGQVWVSATFPRADGQSEVHAIAVDREQIELVRTEP